MGADCRRSRRRVQTPDGGFPPVGAAPPPGSGRACGTRDRLRHGRASRRPGSVPRALRDVPGGDPCGQAPGSIKGRRDWRLRGAARSHMFHAGDPTADRPGWGRSHNQTLAHPQYFGVCGVCTHNEYDYHAGCPPRAACFGPSRNHGQRNHGVPRWQHEKREAAPPVGGLASGSSPELESSVLCQDGDAFAARRQSEVRDPLVDLRVRICRQLEGGEFGKVGNPPQAEPAIESSAY